MKKYLVAVLGIFCSVAISISGCGSVMNEPVSVSIDENGEAYYNPTKVAIYAIQYCGQDSMVEKEVDTNEKKALECIEWLIDNAVVEENGNYVWKNVIYDEYSDMENDVEWVSAYTQSVVIDAFLSYYAVSDDDNYLQYALYASKILMEDVDEGGLLSEKDEEVWFEACRENTGGVV